MWEQTLTALEQASSVILGPPNLVTTEARRNAENVFTNFKKMRDPLEVCHYILERSTDHFVIYNACNVMRDTLIREWENMSAESISKLKTYIFEYGIHKDVPYYIKEVIYTIIGVIVKRNHIDDFGSSLNMLLNELESMINTGPMPTKISAIKIIYGILMEYSTTTKSTDVGLTWDIHFDLKKKFESIFLRRIFSFSIDKVHTLLNMQADLSQLKEFVKCQLEIIEIVLTWGFVSLKLSRRYVKIKETNYLLEEAPGLRLDASWKETFYHPNFITFFFNLFWKYKDERDMCSIVLSCIVQLSTVGGKIFANDADKIHYLVSFLQPYLKLLEMDNIQDYHVRPLSLVIRRLASLYPPAFIVTIPSEVFRKYIILAVQYTVNCMQAATTEEYSDADETPFMDAYTNLLKAWVHLMAEPKVYDSDVIYNIAQPIFNGYVLSRIAPPLGNRPQSTVDDVSEFEESDRIEFQEHLQIMGMFARFIPAYALNCLSMALESKVENLKEELTRQHNKVMPPSNPNVIISLYEDIHWLLLISGHVLCMDSEGETPMIPAQLIDYSLELENRTDNIKRMEEVILKYLVTSTSSDAITSDNLNLVVRLTAIIFRLCELESLALNSEMCEALSPEIASDLMWFLTRWSKSYAVINTNLYTEPFSQLLSLLFASGTQGASWVVDFMISKVMTNLCYFKSNADVLLGSTELFLSIIDTRDNAARGFIAQRSWEFLNTQRSLNFENLPSDARTMLWKALTIGGSGIEDVKSQMQYFQFIFAPLHEKLTAINQPNLMSTYQNTDTQRNIITVMEIIIGSIQGVKSNSVQAVYTNLYPVISELPKLLRMYHNYINIVQLILKIYSNIASCMLLFLTSTQSNSIYESCYEVLKIYAQFNSNRLTVESYAEEDAYSDLMLLMQLLTSFMHRDIVDLSFSNQENVITSADVCIYGLGFIMPLMTPDLLKFPSLAINYFKLLAFINDIYPEKVANMPADLFKFLTNSVEYGLTSCGLDAFSFCLDFLQCTAVFVFEEGKKYSQSYKAIGVFLNLLWKMITENQIDSYYISSVGTTLYSIICSHKEEFTNLYSQILPKQDTGSVSRLSIAFQELMKGVEFNNSRSHKEIFRANFEKFIVKIQMYLTVK